MPVDDPFNLKLAQAINMQSNPKNIVLAFDEKSEKNINWKESIKLDSYLIIRIILLFLKDITQWYTDVQNQDMHVLLMLLSNKSIQMSLVHIFTKRAGTHTCSMVCFKV